jgi:hypothetical protein
MRTLGTGATVRGALIVMGMASLLIPRAHGSLVTAAASLMAAQVGDVCWPVYNVGELSLRQAITPGDVLGLTKRMLPSRSRYSTADRRASHSEDDWQVRPEIHVLLPPVAVKFNFQQRSCSRSGRENSALNYFLRRVRAKWPWSS